MVNLFNCCGLFILSYARALDCFNSFFHAPSNAPGYRISSELVSYKELLLRLIPFPNPNPRKIAVYVRSTASCIEKFFMFSMACLFYFSKFWELYYAFIFPISSFFFISYIGEKKTTSCRQFK